MRLYPPGYLKLNTDGSFRDGGVAFGGLLRDDIGNWIWGYAGRAAGTEALAAELQAILYGLDEAAHRGVLRILVETDSSQAVHLLDHEVAVHDHHLSHLLCQCREARARIWSCGILYAPRCVNTCADRLCKLGHELETPTDVVLFEVPPLQVEALVHADKREQRNQKNRRRKIRTQLKRSEYIKEARADGVIPSFPLLTRVQ